MDIVSKPKGIPSTLPYLLTYTITIVDVRDAITEPSLSLNVP